MEKPSKMNTRNFQTVYGQQGNPNLAHGMLTLPALNWHITMTKLEEKTLMDMIRNVNKKLERSPIPQYSSAYLGSNKTASLQMKFINISMPE